MYFFTKSNFFFIQNVFKNNGSPYTKKTEPSFSVLPFKLRSFALNLISKKSLIYFKPPRYTTPKVLSRYFFEKKRSPNQLFFNQYNVFLTKVPSFFYPIFKKNTIIIFITGIPSTLLSVKSNSNIFSNFIANYNKTMDLTSCLTQNVQNFEKKSNYVKKSLTKKKTKPNNTLFSN